MPGDARRQQVTLQALHPGQCLTASELAATSGLSNRTAVKAIAGLIQRGYARRVEAGCYELTEIGTEARSSGEQLKSGPRRPLTQTCRRWQAPTFRERLWRALRIKKKATIGDLIELAADGSERSPDSNAGRYLSTLLKAGYVRRLPRQKGSAPTSNGFLRYQVIKDTGPEAPVVQRAGSRLYDPNEGRVVWEKGGWQ